jgi:hypothetical protein
MLVELGLAAAAAWVAARPQTVRERAPDLEGTLFFGARARVARHRADGARSSLSQTTHAPPA